MMAYFRALPHNLWPETDRNLWRAAQMKSELLDPGALAARWRDRTKRTVEESYAYALDWLSRNSYLQPLNQLTARWTDSVLVHYIADLQQHTSPATTKSRILNLERALAAMEPFADRAILLLAVRRLEKPTDHAQKRDRLQDPADLEGLGRDLMAAARKGEVPSVRKNAARFRDGLQIALLARRPLRRGNFVGIEIGRHLVADRQGWQLHFPANEMKNHSALELPFPSELAADLEEYLDVYRPLLAGERYRGDRLWLTYRFTAQTPHSFQLSIAHRTERAFGKPINPHLFRDCAATSIAIDDPEHVRVGAAVLGHRSFGTTQRHYNLARTVDAARTVGSFLDNVKQQARRSIQ